MKLYEQYMEEVLKKLLPPKLSIPEFEEKKEKEEKKKRCWIS
jgi:hypothetical protein